MTGRAMAARSDETGTGSAEGNSAVANGDGPQITGDYSMTDISKAEPVPATNEAGEVDDFYVRHMNALAFTPMPSALPGAGAGSDIRVGESLAARDQRIYEQGRRDALEDTDAALATQPATSQEGEKTIEILRRALAWHGDMQRMATTREHWQQTVDEAIIWVKANPEPGYLSFSSFDFAATPTPPTLSEDLREPHVFLDCDGVLADFDTYAEAYFGMNPRAYEKQMGSAKFWEQLEAKGDFYRNLPLMPDAMALFEGVKHLHPTILTGCPRGDWAQGQKVAWAAEHFPGVPIITCRSADKRDYAKPGDVIIDDWPQHRHRWIEMGGVFIVHHDAASSLAALFAHYPALARAQGQA